MDYMIIHKLQTPMSVVGLHNIPTALASFLYQTVCTLGLGAGSTQHLLLRYGSAPPQSNFLNAPERHTGQAEALLDRLASCGYRRLGFRSGSGRRRLHFSHT
jgi:hypothetical protein